MVASGWPLLGAEIPAQTTVVGISGVCARVLIGVLLLGLRLDWLLLVTVPFGLVTVVENMTGHD